MGAITKSRPVWVATAVLAGLAALGAPPAAGYQSSRVVIVVIDGPRLSETFEEPGHAHIPNLWGELGPIGGRIPEFHNEGRTETVAGHAAIVTGTWQALPDNGSERPTKPTIFEYYRSTTGAPITDAWIVTGKYKLDSCSYSIHPDYGSAYRASSSNSDRDDLVTFTDFTTKLATHHPHVSLLSLSQTDIEAHVRTWPGYLAAIARADSLVMALWGRLESDPFYAGQTMLILTYDHGRHLDLVGSWRDHGDTCLGCVRLGFYCAGPDFEPGAISENLRYQIDICPTVALILGIPAPFTDGAVFSELFSLTAIGGELPAPAGTTFPAIELAPNPFNPAVEIRVTLAAGSFLRVGIHDVLGRQVRALWSGAALPGLHAWTWDGRGESGEPRASGLYYVVVRSGAEDAVRKAVLVR